MMTKLIEESWQEFKRKSGLPNTSTQATAAARMLYFAGAAAMVRTIVEATEGGMDDVVNSICDELDAFNIDAITNPILARRVPQTGYAE